MLSHRYCIYALTSISYLLIEPKFNLNYKLFTETFYVYIRIFSCFSKDENKNKYYREIYKKNSLCVNILAINSVSIQISSISFVNMIKENKEKRKIIKWKILKLNKTKTREELYTA